MKNYKESRRAIEVVKEKGDTLWRFGMELKAVWWGEWLDADLTQCCPAAAGYSGSQAEMQVQQGQCVGNAGQDDGSHIRAFPLGFRLF